MEILSDKGLEELRFRIIQQACIDYEASLKYLRKHPDDDDRKTIAVRRMKNDCVRFFNSSYFSSLCDIDGDRLMNQIRTKYVNIPIRWRCKTKGG